MSRQSTMITWRHRARRSQLMAHWNARMPGSHRRPPPTTIKSQPSTIGQLARPGSFHRSDNTNNHHRIARRRAGSDGHDTADARDLGTTAAGSSNESRPGRHHPPTRPATATGRPLHAEPAVDELLVGRDPLLHDLGGIALPGAYLVCPGAHHVDIPMDVR